MCHITSSELEKLSSFLASFPAALKSYFIFFQNWTCGSEIRTITLFFFSGLCSCYLLQHPSSSPLLTQVLLCLLDSAKELFPRRSPKSRLGSFLLFPFVITLHFLLHYNYIVYYLEMSWHFTSLKNCVCVWKELSKGLFNT